MVDFVGKMIFVFLLFIVGIVDFVLMFICIDCVVEVIFGLYCEVLIDGVGYWL